ncbi:MAG: hypothetical protein GXP31_03515 [Kiritimatiellaeota bacterium]|nr:hypothetical protein [Kiritimatiellota bacterium]
MRTSRWFARIAILGCLAGLIALPLPACAQEDEELRNDLQENLEDLKNQIGELRERLARARDEAADQVRQWWRRKQDEWRAESGKAEPLGQAVRLEFSFQPSDLPAVSVGTATTRYTIESYAEQPGRNHRITVTGSLKEADKPDGSLLLTFDAAIELEQENDSLQTLRANGSVRVAVGKSIALASVGQYTLKVLVQPAKAE